MIANELRILLILEDDPPLALHLVAWFFGPFFGTDFFKCYRKIVDSNSAI